MEFSDSSTSEFEFDAHAGLPNICFSLPHGKREAQDEKVAQC